MCRDPEDGKDVLQETLLAAARGMREFRGASSLSTWLYAIARSFCIKKRRKSKFAPGRERSLEEHATLESRQLVDPDRRPDEALAGKQVEHALERAIGALEPMYREVLLLRDVEGLTAPEVSEVLGIGVRAVKSRLHRARLSVRQHMQPLPEAPAGARSCPDVVALFSQHLDGEIRQEVCRQMEQHLNDCSRCRETCSALKRTLMLCRRSGPAVEIPASVQASVKGALRDFLAESA
jgi:RNA polymerase sigma-70 factor (ECF subfamily)